MVAYELEGVEIDHCVSCGGTWLDGGELEQIAEVAGAPSEDLARAVEAAGSGKRTRMRCPRCPTRLREIRIGDSPTVQVDHCPEGHGLWFDRGEMLTAIRAYAGEKDAVVARFFAELYRSEIESVSGGE
jgi:Zn-finger nucleic acid-binding protein